MRPFARTLALAAAALVAVGIGTSTASASGAARSAAAAPCTGTVAITQLAWSTPSVVPGQTPCCP